MRGRVRAIFIGDTACNLGVLFSANYVGRANATIATGARSAITCPDRTLSTWNLGPRRQARECLKFHFVDGHECTCARCVLFLLLLLFFFFFFFFKEKKETPNIAGRKVQHVRETRELFRVQCSGMDIPARGKSQSK